jgi:hypothetical protein
MKQTASSMRAGIAWGAVGGLVLALLLARRHPHLHLHGGEIAVVFAICLTLGVAVGAAVASIRDRRLRDADGLTGSAGALGHPKPDQHDH